MAMKLKYLEDGATHSPIYVVTFLLNLLGSDKEIKRYIGRHMVESSYWFFLYKKLMHFRPLLRLYENNSEKMHLLRMRRDLFFALLVVSFIGRKR